MVSISEYIKNIGGILHSSNIFETHNAIIRGGYRIPVNNEEKDLILKFKEQSGVLSISDMSEREAEISRRMLSRGLLLVDSENDNAVISYRLNSLDDAWR